jgi:hypothetical protein
MQVKVVSAFSYDHIAREARKFTDKAGKEQNWEAQPARTSKCALVEVGEGCRVQVEFPSTYTREVSEGDLLSIECGQLTQLLTMLDRPAIISNISKHVKKVSQK